MYIVCTGTGAALGFIIDGIKWNEIFGVDSQGIQIKVVYAFAMAIYFIVTVMTLTSIKVRSVFEKIFLSNFYYLELREIRR